ncbi:MAG: SprT family zinc-dependent metalloprotease [Pseudomonadales bacterium]
MKFRPLKKLPEYVSVSPRPVKWARIQVHPTGEVKIVVPRALSGADIVSFYQSKQGWIEDKRQRALARQSERLQLANDELVLFGRTFQVCLDASQKRAARIDHEALSIAYAKDLQDPDERHQWYRCFAKHYLSFRLVQLAEQHGFEFNRLFIREQKTRWGSCSSRGNISLNWKLIKAPVWVSDYVILHELVHTEIMNHSLAFWQRVEGVCPEYKRAKAWLKRYGFQL